MISQTVILYYDSMLTFYLVIERYYNFTDLLDIALAIYFVNE